MTNILNFLKNEKLTIIGLSIGLLAGFAYWKFVGCNSGSCPITSSPYMSTIWGGLIGGLLFSSFKKEKK